MPGKSSSLLKLLYCSSEASDINHLLSRHATDFFLDQFGMSAEHSQALQAVHGAVHGSDVGVKYTWFGSGYISNMYYKWIANHPTYSFDRGGDLSFDGCLIITLAM